MGFYEAKEKGKAAERRAEEYLKRKNLYFLDIRENPRFQKHDIDYIANGYGAVEVKSNWQKALKGKPGRFFWIELSITSNGGERPGWFYFSKADWHFFFGACGNGVLIRNDRRFKAWAECLMANGDHSAQGLNRYDYKNDLWFGKHPVTAKNMRIYREQLYDAPGVEYKTIAKRRKRG